MVNPLRITYVNHADAAILSGIGAISSLPLSNLKTDDIQEVFRGTATSAAGPQVINVDLGAIKTVGCIALINCNLFAPVVTVEITLSTNDPNGVTGMTYSATVQGIPDPVYNKFVHFIEPQAEARYVLIWMQNIPVPPEAGRLVIGETWAPTRDMRYGFEPLWRDFSVRSRSLGGNEFIDVRPRQRGYRFTILGLSESEAQEQVDRLNLMRGIGRDILVCRNKDSSDMGRDTVWGLLEQPVAQRRLEGRTADEEEELGMYEIEVEVWDRT